MKMVIIDSFLSGICLCAAFWDAYTGHAWLAILMTACAAANLFWAVSSAKQVRS